MRVFKTLPLFLLLDVLYGAEISAFTICPTVVSTRSTIGFSRGREPFKSFYNKSVKPLEMGFNLPPGNRGPGGSYEEVIPGILTLAGIALFLFSPLGGIFFAITNSLFLFAFLTPVILFVGFQIWQAFYTLEDACPSCSVPVRVMKDEKASPVICFSCGKLVRSTRAKNGIELCNDPNSILQDNEGSIFGNSFFGGGGRSDIFNEEELFSSNNQADRKNSSSAKDKAKREGTIIDVDIEET